MSWHSLVQFSEVSITINDNSLTSLALVGALLLFPPGVTGPLFHSWK